MEIYTIISSNPLFYLTIWIVGERMGLPITKIVVKLLRLEGNGTGKKLDLLTEHYNHETTVVLTEIKDKLGEMHDCLKKANNTLAEFEKFGIKPRKE